MSNTDGRARAMATALGLGLIGGIVAPVVLATDAEAANPCGGLGRVAAAFPLDKAEAKDDSCTQILVQGRYNDYYGNYFYTSVVPNVRASAGPVLATAAINDPDGLYAMNSFRACTGATHVPCTSQTLSSWHGSTSWTGF